jgi:hypothetical protein
MGCQGISQLITKIIQFKMRFDGAELAANLKDKTLLDADEDGTQLYNAVDTRVLSTWTKKVSVTGCDGLTEASLIKR